MIYIYDELTKQFLYINKYHVIVIIPIEAFTKYELFLTGDNKARVNRDTVERIRKALL